MTRQYLTLPAAALLLATAAAAQQPDSMHKGMRRDSSHAGMMMRHDGADSARHREMMGRMFKDITLTDDQKKSVAAIHDKHRAEMDKISGGEKGGGGMARMDSAHTSQMRAHMTAMMDEMRAGLTPDQQKLFDANRKREEGMMWRKEMREGEGMRKGDREKHKGDRDEQKGDREKHRSEPVKADSTKKP